MAEHHLRDVGASLVPPSSGTVRGKKTSKSLKANVTGTDCSGTENLSVSSLDIWSSRVSAPSVYHETDKRIR